MLEDRLHNFDDIVFSCFLPDDWLNEFRMPQHVLVYVYAGFLIGIKEQVNTIVNRYNKWLYLFLNILFATCYRNNVYISFHFHMGMDHFFRVSYLLQRLLPLSYLVQNQLFE